VTLSAKWRAPLEALALLAIGYRSLSMSPASIVR